jgi:hypothetical protein
VTPVRSRTSGYAASAVPPTRDAFWKYSDSIVSVPGAAAHGAVKPLMSSSINAGFCDAHTASETANDSGAANAGRARPSTNTKNANAIKRSTRRFLQSEASRPCAI